MQSFEHSRGCGITDRGTILQWYKSKETYLEILRLFRRPCRSQITSGGVRPINTLLVRAIDYTEQAHNKHSGPDLVTMRYTNVAEKRISSPSANVPV